MTLRDDLLGDIDDIRGIPGELGLRLFTVTVLTRASVGARPGVGSSVDATATLAVARGSFDARVRNLTSKDVIASGGLYTDQDVKVGPFTPPFDGGGTEISVFDPASTGSGLEVYFKITGPGYSADGDWFKRIASDTSKPFAYTLTLRKTGKVPVAP